MAFTLLVIHVHLVYICLAVFVMRPLLIRFLFFATVTSLLFLGRAWADSTVVFNEIMYHPATNEAQFEWIELFNQMGVDMDISNWSLANGVQFTFPEGTIIRGGGFLVVALSPSTLASAGVTNAMGPFTGRLSNSGERLELRNNNQRLMDSVQYGVDGEWPARPNGAGASLAKIDPDTASADPANWSASAQMGGTPGAPNFPSVSGAAKSSTLLPIDSTWRFQNSGADLGTGWRTTNFDDAAWISGKALFYAGTNQPPAGESVSIPTLFNTGVGSDRTVLPPGVPDPHYLLTASAQALPVPPPVAATVIQYHPAWLANDSSSSWIGPVNPGTANVAAGAYRYRTSFDLSGFDLNTVQLTLDIASDNRVTDVLLNGVSKGISFVGFAGFSSDFSITNGFLNGTNSLEFLSFNDTTSPNPAGFRAKVYGVGKKLLPRNTRLETAPTTTYFRSSFVFNGVPDSTLLQLQAVVEGGAIFYVNGVEVFRVNLPAGAIDFSTLATNNPTNRIWNGLVPISTGNLIAGANELAVELHPSAGKTNELFFGAELLMTTIVPSKRVTAFTPQDVIINEIMYHAHDLAPGLSSSESWIELYNRGSNSVDLSGWQLAKAIDFTFPPGTQIPPDAYLVISSDIVSFRAAHPGIPVLGNFSKSLSHHSDLVMLKDAHQNPVNEVPYYNSRPWPDYADGGGSSLELRNPSADNSKAESWAASDEASRSQWHAYSYTGVAASDGGPTLWKEFDLGLLNSGEVLLDDLSVIESPSSAPKELLQNGTFENGLAAWRIIGNHHGEIILDPSNPANHVLHLTATGPTEHMHNHAETTLAGGASIVNGRQYKISFRAKWLAGSSQLHTRLYFNRLAQVTLLDVPAQNGTPGARNSRFEPNIGPSYAGFRHQPAVPDASQPVTVSIFAQDPDGVSGCALGWSANGGAWNTTTMALMSSGSYTAAIPGYPAGTVVQFYVEGQDAQGAKSTFPARGRSSRALYKVNDGQAILGRAHNLRLIMTSADAAFMHAVTNVMSNDDLGATVVYDEAQVFYDVNVHLQSSERGRSDASRVGFTIGFHSDDLFRGVHDSITVDRSGGYSGLGGRHDEIILKHAMNHAGGLAGMYDDVIRFIAPLNQHTGSGLLLMSKYGSDFLSTQYPNGNSGQEYKLELIYYPLTTTDSNPQSPKLPQPDDVIGVDFQDLGNNPEAYRWNFLIENNRDADNFAPVMNLAKILGSSASAMDAPSQQFMDVDQWMRAFAMKSLTGDADTYSQGYPHNLIVYFRPDNSKALAFLWDQDFAWTRPFNAGLYGGANIAKLISLPANKRSFYAHLNDIIATSFNTNYLAPWAAYYGSMAGENYAGITTYIGQRAAFVRSQFPARVPFAVTGNSSSPILVTSNSISLTGTAWLDTRRIAIEGWPVDLSINWPGLTSWQTVVPLILGTNRLNMLAYDFRGQLLASNLFIITSSAMGGGLDSDGDGMPDIWEIGHGLNPGSKDAALDSDGDGMTNLEEYLAGTDPRDLKSYLRLDATASTNGVHLTFHAVAGRSYTIQRREALGSGSWTNLQSIVPAADDRNIDLSDESPVGSATRFYRVITPGAP